eukprot:4786902-Prymnesium_polylepis.2
MPPIDVSPCKECECVHETAIAVGVGGVKADGRGKRHVYLFAPCTTDSRGKPSSVSASIATNASRPCADTVCRSVRSNTMTSSWAFSAVSRSCAVINGATYERKQFASAYVT